MKRACGHRTAVATWLGRAVTLAVAGTIGFATQADAAVYWSDYDYGYSEPPVPMVPLRAPKPRKPSAKKSETAAKQATRPHGALIVAISINRQRLRIYDANGFFAETPISTGMRGHPTPMGVFSVIQKQKFHKSNIYSDAPMPFMQRITWSGIAMHAGVLPGYPASHGCIRMPMAFAVKMYGWTRMGARVVITPGEMTPISFSHPLLAVRIPAPEPMAAAEPKADTVKSDVAKADVEKADVEKADIGNADAAKADLTLRSSVGHSSLPTSADAPAAPAPLREQTRTADAGAYPAGKAVITMSDATTPTPGAAAKDGAAAVGEHPDDAGATATTEPSKSGMGGETAPDTGAGNADVDKDILAEARAMRRNGPISVFISRKDGKLYVRQNFAPLFEAPVTIAPSDRPLGTHVFTVEANQTDPIALQWSVISLPAPTRDIERHDEEERNPHRRKMAITVALKPAPEPDTPAEALDRLTIPADTMARITGALSTGSSIIVSDQGIAAGETGEGTGFIVPLR